MDHKKYFASEENKKKKKGQIFRSPPLQGLSQMACDVVMLEKIETEPDTSMAIRFYKWDGAWLSIGHNQRELPQHWIALARKKKLRIVRRPTGGSSVLHSGGLTYSLAWNSPPKKKHLAYIETTKWLIDCFKDLGIKLRLGNQSSTFPSGNCFNTSTIADLVDNDGTKRIGSAQFWRKGNLLQHGEILLAPPKKLWVELFKQNPPSQFSTNISSEKLEHLLSRQVVRHWPQLNWGHKDFTSNELQKILTTSKNYLVNLSNSDF